MKPLSWFRMYIEAVDDEKLRLLAFEDRWHFVAILCCKGSGILDDADESLMWRKVAVKLGLDQRELGEVARRLAEVGLIDAATLQPLAWQHRQFQSDSSSERVKAYRERMKRHGNVSVTAQETETETETEKRVGASPRRGSRFTLTQLPDEWRTFCKANRPDLNPDVTFERFSDYWGAQPGRQGLKLDWLKTWRNWVRSEKAAPGVKVEVKPWHETASGTTAKGRELGLDPAQFVTPTGAQDWQAFRSAVLRKAGVQARAA